MQPSTATNLWFYPCYRRSPFFAATRKTLRRLSSAISDIWAAPADPDRWGLILPKSQKSGGEPAVNS